MRRSRSGAISLGLAAMLLTLPACSSGSAAAIGQQGDYKVEVFTSWDGLGEREALDTLIDDFKRLQPGIEYVDTVVSGAAGGNARAVLATRLNANDPPDSFQAHAGVELVGDVKAGDLEALNTLYDRQGWKNKFPKQLIDAVTVDGKIYSVPIDVHRSNLLWYNPKVLAAVGIGGPPKTWDEFLTQTSAIKAKGITPLALGPEWTQKQLMENVLLGELGVEGYNGLWNGKTDWGSNRVTTALTTYARVIANSDVKNASGDWQPMLDKMMSGTVAYVVMGDWADAYLNKVKNLAYKVDFNAVASPGTAGVYNFSADVFTLPKGAAHRGAAEKWLIECGSVAAQDLFNPLKGGVPARLDTDVAKYDGYQATAIAEWQSSSTKVVGSLTHGAVASGAWNTEIDAALARFVEDSDPYTFADSVAKSYQATR